MAKAAIPASANHAERRSAPAEAGEGVAPAEPCREETLTGMADFVTTDRSPPSSHRPAGYFAVDAAPGKQLWQKPGSSVVPMYPSHAFSPLADRGLVIFHVGGHDEGALTAFDMNTGDVKWSWKGDGPGYGSPVVATLGGPERLAALLEALAKSLGQAKRKRRAA